MIEQIVHFCAEPFVKFLEKQAQSFYLVFNVHRLFDPKKPIVIISWLGKSQTLQSIALITNMDVLPPTNEASEASEQWSHPQFSAEIDENCRIYGVGTRGARSVGMQHLASLRDLKKDGKTLERTVHLIFTPDKEIGSKNGLKEFVKHDIFRSLDIGFAITNGEPSKNNSYFFSFGERAHLSKIFVIENMRNEIL